MQTTPSKMKKNKHFEEINNNESSLNSLMTNSPKIKKLLNELKKKNQGCLKSSRGNKKNQPIELDPTQQMWLKTLNENLKKSLQEKKIVNIRNSYKFLIGGGGGPAIVQQNCSSKERVNTEENPKRSPILPKSRIQSFSFYLTHFYLNLESVENNLKKNMLVVKSQENFKPLSARTHLETQKSVDKQKNLSTKPSVNKKEIINIMKIPNFKDPSKPFIFKGVPPLNLDSLLQKPLEEVRFLTPREHK